jgi:hypothetical protein
MNTRLRVCVSAHTPWDQMKLIGPAGVTAIVSEEADRGLVNVMLATPAAVS